MENAQVFLTLLLFLVFCITMCCIQYHYRRRRLYELAAQFKGPPTLPLIGNALSCFIPLTEMANVTLQGSIKYKSPVRLWFGPWLIIGLYEPRDLEIVLNSSSALDKDPYIVRNFKALTGHGLVILPGNQWKRHRRLMLPSFRKKIIESYLSIFCKHSEKLVEILKPKVDKGFFDVSAEVINCTLGSILETSLGIKGHSKGYEVGKWTDKILKIIMERFPNIFYISDFIFNMSRNVKELNDVKTKYKNYIDSVIQQWKEDLAQKRHEKEDKESTKTVKLLEHLLLLSEEEDGKFTDEELRDEVQTIIFGGFGTTSSMVSFTLVLLGMFPEVQEKVFQEILNVVGRDGPITCEDLKKLEYTEQVIKESMRLFPVALGFTRCSKNEIQLENHIIPAKTTILIGLFHLHRNPDIFPEPNKFDPDRFLPEEVSKRHPYSYMPFLAGPRGCIGTTYAWLSMKSIIIHVLRAYRVHGFFRSLEDIQILTTITLAPTQGFKISLSNRA